MFTRTGSPVWWANGSIVCDPSSRHGDTLFRRDHSLFDRGDPLIPRADTSIRREVAAICAERSQHLPRSEQLPWWEELGVPVRRMLGH